MKSTRQNKKQVDAYPDYEQSWLFEDCLPQAVPQCGLIVEKIADKVTFHDDEFPGLMFTSESLGREYEK